MTADSIQPTEPKGFWACAYALCFGISLHLGNAFFPMTEPGGTAIWPASAFAIAAFVFAPWRWLAPLAVLIFTMALGPIVIGTGDHWITGMSLVAYGLEIGIVSWAFRYVAEDSGPVTLRSIQEFLLFIGVAVCLAPWLGGSFAALAVANPGTDAHIAVWVSWALASGLGTLVILPLLLNLPGIFQHSVRMSEWLATTAAAALCVGVLQIESEHFALLGIELLFPVVFLFAYRFSVFSTVLLTAIVGGAIMLSGFGEAGGVVSDPGGLIAQQNLQFFLAVIVVTAQVLAVVSSESRAVQRDLYQSEARLRAILDNAPVAIVMKDAQKRYLVANRTFSEWTGIPVTEILGKDATQILTGDSGSIINSHDEEVLRTGTPRTYEVPVQSHRGNTRHVLSTKFLMPSIGGAERCTCSVIMDISELHEKERIIQQNEKRFEDFARAASDWFWETDPNERFTYVSAGVPEVGETFGQSIIGKRRQDLIVDVDDVKGYDAFRQAIAKRQAFREFVYLVRRPDEDHRWVSVSGVPLFDDDVLIGYRGVTRDVHADRLNRETAKAVQKSEAIAQLTGGVAHDFNNLLAIILFNLELTKRDLDGILDPETEQLLDDAVSAGEQGKDLTAKLLVLGRRRPLERDVIPVGRVFANVDGLLHRTLGPGTELRFDISGDVIQDPDALAVVTDQTLFESTLINLIINARDAISGNGTITVRAVPGTTPGDPDTVRIDVVDAGPGIPPELLERVIEPFFTTKEVGQGTGLGLSMAHSFAIQSGGDLSIESTLGHGTTVSLTLPRSLDLAPAKDKLASGPDGEARGHETLLVVDDEERIRRSLRRYLTSLGYTVITAPDGPSALAVLWNHPEVALLLTDILMPGGIDGDELALEAKRRRPGLKVVKATGTRQRLRGLDGSTLEVEPDPVLRKPFAPAVLAATIRAMLDGLDPRKTTGGDKQG